MNPGEGLPYSAAAFEVQKLVNSPHGVQLLRVLDGKAPLETVTALKRSAVGPTMLPPPAIFRGQVQA